MSRLDFKFELKAQHSEARAASITTLHGEIQTPVFMPVGTQATVKSQSVDLLRISGSKILLANTYHLLLRPGPEVFKRFGGIHRFMNWGGPVLTDSGGFQIFSLPNSRRMNEEGAHFQSYVDGKTHLLSPEASIEMQRAINSDIMMVLDQCISSTAGHDEAKTAMELTHRWAMRSLQARGDSVQSLFGIVQGACFQDLRKISAEFLTNLPFDGFAIGGLAVGESKKLREDFTEFTAALLPQNLPRYLMGVGTPIDILEAVHRGVDMFDCILPSSLAQRGVAYTSRGKLQLRRGVYKFSEEVIDPVCACGTCKSYSRAYIHHLIKAEELLGWQLLTTHNLTFYHQMMREIRESILQDRFIEYYKSKRVELVRVDEDNPNVASAKQKRLRSMRWQELGDYEVHASPFGFANIRQRSSGEVMHSVSNPAEEANRLYIEQSRLKERLNEQGSELVIWDVGLGAASNVMAAINCFEAALAQNPVRSLRIVSFERDMDPLLLASKHPEKFPHLRHGAPYKLIENGYWDHSSGLLHWELLKGDFLELMESARAPDIIFYDPFSFKTDAKLWTASVFERIHKHCKDVSTELYTYSSSTAVRAALLSAGFFVAPGVTTGPKAETTIAYINALSRVKFLGKEWLEKWHRSQAKFPADLSPEEKIIFERSIVNHPQFMSGV